MLKYVQILTRAVSIQVGRRSGGRLAMTLVATISIITFFSFLFFPPPSPFPPCFFFAVYFSHRRNALFEKTGVQKLTEIPKNLMVDTFPDPIGHFWVL